MRRHLRAITLLELLIVVAMTALLLGLLLPALSGLRKTGRRVECAAHLRQMSFAAGRYASDYDAWPAAIRFEPGDGGLRRVAWDWVTTMDGALVGPGPLWLYTDHPDRVQQCPEYHGSSNYSGDPATGYNYNTSYLGGEARFPRSWDGMRSGLAPAVCRRSSLCAMFGDGGGAAGANKFMRSPLDPNADLPIVYSGGQAFRHGDGTNVGYIDGHVARVDDPRPGERATERLLTQFLDFPDNGFLTDDDRAYDPR